MSKRRGVLQAVGAFRDLGDVVQAMKNLAIAEIGKLSRTHDARRSLVKNIVAPLKAFARLHPPPAAPPGATADIVVAVGSERGFCGDFNDFIVSKVTSVRTGLDRTHMLIVGSRLGEKMSDVVATRITGANSMEDIPDVIVRVLETLEKLALRIPHRDARVLAIADIADGPESIPLLPPAGLEAKGQSSPTYEDFDLNLPPDEVLAGLLHAYLDAALTQVFAGSLMSENRARLEHMSGALQRIDERIGELTRLSNHLRQEEITQEIELIMLSDMKP